MLSLERLATVRRLFYAEHWKIGTIASQLAVHPDAVRRALATDPLSRPRRLRASRLDPYLEFIRSTLEQYPRLRATRLFQMLQPRGYAGSVVQLRRLVRRLRPIPREAFLRLTTFPGEQAQVDWADFGRVAVGRALRRLSCFVLRLSYSRALYLSFFFDQSLENFLRGHVRAFSDLGGVPRVILYDNLRSVVLERRGEAFHFHPRLLELCAHYHFQPQPCRPARGNEKGGVERAIQDIRTSFFPARPFTTLADFNAQALRWRDDIVLRRRWPGDCSRTVAELYAEEKPRLLGLPAHPLDTDLVLTACSRKTIYLRFDLNDYSIPPQAVGRPLTLVASDTIVRILDGSTELARHRRSYDRGQLIEEPAHKEALLPPSRWSSSPRGVTCSFWAPMAWARP
jgi:transposase